MNVWDLERRVIDIIGVELQVPRREVRPDAHLIQDLGGDWFAIDRLSEAIKSELSIHVASSAFERCVWDLIKQCHKESGAWTHSFGDRI